VGEGGGVWEEQIRDNVMGGSNKWGDVGTARCEGWGVGGYRVG